jgi:tRNA dimethylallyltransferase
MLDEVASRHSLQDGPSTILAVFGPTGVGKTALAIALAEQLRANGDRPVAISADALQVYAGLEILTGVASPAEQARLEHRLVSFVPVDARFSVAEHARLAHAEIDALLAKGRTPIVVGGTGLYLRAALAELDLRPAAPDEIRARWTQRLQAEGAPALHAELRRRAPWAAEGISPNDAHRLVRLLELDDLGELEPPDDSRPSQLWTEHTRHPTRLLGVTMEREALYARIDQRVDAMVAEGALEEVRAAHAAGASETARKALGFADLLAGDIDAMKRRTRNYARRQLTWMRKLPGVELVDLTERTPQDAARDLVVASR